MTQLQKTGARFHPEEEEAGKRLGQSPSLFNYFWIVEQDAGLSGLYYAYFTSFTVSINCAEVDGEIRI